MTSESAAESLDAPTDPERLVLVIRVGGAGGPESARFALVRDGDEEPLRLLNVAGPTFGTGLAEVVADVLGARLGVEPAGEPLACGERRPHRVARWREGRVDVGWVRAVAVTVDAELDPAPPLIEVEALPLDEAEAALATSLERALLRDGAALLEG
ncbi:MAG: hypothetical protein F4Y98_05135 [Chloroflexi bacterium]|nr:hypothetical protein [Chloroflexota bacterium]